MARNLGFSIINPSTPDQEPTNLSAPAGRYDTPAEEIDAALQAEGCKLANLAGVQD